MLHVCRKCKEMAEIAEYRARRSDYTCQPCHRASRRLAPRPQLSTEEHHRRQLVRVRARQAHQRGKLERGSCEVCGSAAVEGHHDDYSKPLSVRWLCRPHHRELHRQAKEQ